MQIGVITVRLITKRSLIAGRIYGKNYHYIFMMKSADGRISTGSTEEIDIDRDFMDNPGIGEELHQYWDRSSSALENSNTALTVFITSIGGSYVH